MPKTSNNQEALRKRVYAFLNLHPKENKRFILNHFRMEKFLKSTLYDILQQKKNNIGPERKVGSCHIAKKKPLETDKTLRKIDR